MSLYTLKPRFQALLRPLVRRLAARGITANHITLLACALSLALGLLLATHADHPRLFFLLPLWCFLRMALNAIDGMLAREHHQQSALGGYLNEITDIISDAALILPFAFIAPFTPLAVGVFIFLAALSETCGILGHIHGNGRRYDGPLGKSDRAFALGTLAFVHALFAPLPHVFCYLFWLLNALLILTCIRRVRQGLAQP